MAPSVMGNDAVAVLGEEEHLAVPVVGAERTAVAKDDGRTGFISPILIEKLRIISERDERHFRQLKRSG